MIIAVLDFESYYSKTYSLSKLTTEEYITGPEFEVIGFSIKLGNQLTQWYSGDRAYLKNILDTYDWSKIALCCHNTLFDASILSFYFGIYAAKYIDTLSMARALHGISVGGSLAKLARYYELGEKGTEVIDALGKHCKDFSLRELYEYGNYCINDTDLTYKLFLKLQPHFSITELSLIDITIKMAVQPLLEADLYLLDEHLKEVQEAKQKLLDRLAIDKKEIMSNPKFGKLLIAQGVEPPMKVSPVTGTQTYAFAKTDEGLLELLEHENEIVRTLVEVRLGVKSSIEETRTETLIGVAKRLGTLPVPLSYYGAATGRFSAAGGQKINWQNVPRDSKIRAAVHAPKGHVIVASDLSNIELRVLLWLSGEHDKLKILGDGLDLYKVFATNVFNVGYNEVSKKQRFIAKSATLGLGFQVGWEKLRTVIKSGLGLDIGDEEAKRIVDFYRQTHPGVIQFWKDCEKTIAMIIDDLHGFLGYNNVLIVEGKAGIRFPSGLHMKYPQLHRALDERNYEIYRYKLRNGWDKLYSGRVTNNVTQGLARCVMGDAMVRIAKRYDIVNSIHDAVYIVVDEGEAEEAAYFLDEEMCRVPEWMPGIPLAAETHYGGRTLADC